MRTAFKRLSAALAALAITLATVLAALLAANSVAAADELGPGSTACADAGAAVHKAQLILTARANVDTAAAATKTAAGALATAKAAALELDATLDVSGVASVKAAVAYLTAFIADPSSPQGELAKAKDKLAADNSLLAAFSAVDSAATATAKAADAYTAAGGDEVLQKLAVAGGLPRLVSDQDAACAKPGTTPSATPTPAPAPVTGSFSQLGSGDVPVGGVETGQLD